MVWHVAVIVGIA